MEGALERLITDARARLVRNLIFDQTLQALSLGFAGAIVLLVTGTQLLHWFWPLALFAASLAFGIWRVRSRIPAEYSVAQRIDAQLLLEDSLSTAWHFNTGDIGNSSEDVRRAQHKQAEQKAAGIDPAIAAPFVWPKSIRWCALLGAAAIAMFGVRYGVQKSLDLARPLVAFDLNPFTGGVREVAKANKPNSPMEDFMKSISVQPPDQQQGGLDPAPDSALGTVDVPDVNNDNSERASGRQTDEKGPGSGDPNEQSEQGDKGGGDGGDQKGNNEPSPKGQAQDTKGKQQDAAGQQAQQPGENSSLLDKMKDALSNLMSKMNTPQNKPGEAQNKQSAQKGGQQSANARQAQKGGQQSKGQQGQEAQQSNSQQGDQDMQDPSQSAQGKSGDRNSQQTSNSENKSGQGKQDGDKDVKLAEQLAAMGKISEIIGKRNQNLQGEVMIEVSSSKQQLRTQYTSRSATHAESGGEIHRDEVPLAYQNYVQHYFDEVRKDDGKKAAAAPKK